ncbi:ROK family transcriptional regulator [Nocardioides ferulae]|uniref:ROK family transcriptional regulator n=1 Tax=Nocardioides ferulae TaxID=2340821 RepID=UPI000EB5C93A|nr:ROK family transcriptional regulator [Nocardioides ferulae]
MAGSSQWPRLTARDRLLHVLGTEGALSRSDLVRRTGLSRSTITTLVAQLLTEQVLVERQDRGTPLNGRGGRPPILLELAEPAGVVLGLDLGHRHIRAGLARLDGTMLAERLLALDVDASPAASLDRVAGLVEALLDESGHDRADVRAVGMGIPGPVDRTGTMTSGILPRWRGTRPGEALTARTGLVARVDNDAHMGARGELAYGAARGRRDVIYVKTSTGIGCGIIIDGKLVGGATGIAGELGHVQVDEHGIICRCGSRGCLETEVSGPKLVELLQPAYDEPLTIPRVIALAEDGDAGANRALGDVGRRIGRVLADMCNLLNPELVVTGGAIGASPAFLAGVRDAIDRHAQPTAAAAVEVAPGALGEDAELRGAISVALEVGAPPAIPR